MQLAAQHRMPTGREAPVARPAGRKLDRGRTWFLAAGDLTALTLAYAICLTVSGRIGNLPPVSAPAWLLAFLAAVAVPTWLAFFTAYRLYGRDSLRISCSCR